MLAVFKEHHLSPLSLSFWNRVDIKKEREIGKLLIFDLSFAYLISFLIFKVKSMSGLSSVFLTFGVNQTLSKTDIENSLKFQELQIRPQIDHENSSLGEIIAT